MTLRPTVERPRALSRRLSHKRSSQQRQVRRRHFRALLEQLEARNLMAFNITENFETWGGAGFSLTPGPGQLLSVWGGSGMATPLTVGAEISGATDWSRGTDAGGGVTQGGAYAFTTPGPNTIFGFQPTGSAFNPGTFTRYLLNDGTAVTNPVISFNRWVNNDAPRSNTFNVSYSFDDVTYTPIPSLDYASPLAADALGLVDLGLQTVTLTGVTVPPNSGFAVRFSSADNGGSGARDEFGIDNLSIVGGVVAPNSPPVNTAPAGPLLGTEDSNLPIQNPIPISVFDPETAQNLATTVAVNPADGTLTANQGTGTAAVSFLNGGSTVAILGTATQINLALQTLVFVPLPNRYTTTTPPTPVVVTVSTTDGSLLDTDTFNITLNEINDPPVVGADTLPAVNEDAAPIVIPIATLLSNDSRGPNENDQTLIMSPTFTAVTGGTVQIVGTDVVFTLTPNFNGTASFNYTVTDNGTNGGMPTPLQGSGTVSFTVTSINDAPSFTPGPNQTRPFGTNTLQTVNGWASAISAGGGETQTFTFELSNNNNPLFSVQPAISSAGVLTFTPTGTAGSATVTVVLRDSGGTAGGGVDATTPLTFQITISAAGNPPTISTINPVTINEDAGLQTVNFSGVTDGADGAQQGIAISASSSNPTLVPNPTVTYSSPAATGSLSFTPAADASGTATITVTVTDSGIDLSPGTIDDVTTTTTFLVTVNPVNDRPTFTAASPAAVNEDAAAQTIPSFVIAFNPGPGNDAGQTVTAYTVSGVSNPGLFLVTPAVATNGTLTYQLNPNVFGSSTFNVTVTDNGGGANGGLDTSLSQQFTITVNPVNDRPTISVLGDQTVPFNAPAQSIPNFVTAVVGPGNEAGQTMTYTIVTNTDPTLFLVQPSIAPDGTLTYTPAAGQQGTSTIVITGTDSGGMLNGGLNESFSANFTITIDAPTPNLPPTINAVAPVTVNEDATLQTVNFSGVTGGADVPAQSVIVTAVSSNPTLIPNPTVSYSSPSTTGSLSFAPAANLNGTATITITVTDAGLDLIPGTGDESTTTTAFLVTVNTVNDQPTITIPVAAHTNAEDAGAQSVPGFATGIAAGPTDEAGQALTFNITGNNNPALFAVGPSIAADGTLTYTAAPNAFGSATISVTLSDNGGTANGGIDTSVPRTFTINVTPVNDAPTFAVGPDRNVPNTAGAQTLTGQAMAISVGPANEAGQAVTFTISGNTNSAIFAIQPTVSSNGTLTFTPAPGASGLSTITIVAQDNGGTAGGGVDVSAPQSFTITVLNNSPPTITPINDINVNENAGPQVVNLTGITAGGEAQTLSVTATSSNPAFIPNPSISYTSANTTGTLMYASAVGQIGSATITVTVRDAGFDGALNTPDDQVITEPFTITVLAVNDPPVANDQTLSAALNTPVNGVLTLSDPDGPLPIYSILMNPALGTISNFNAATGEFTYTPALDATGLDLFTFTVSDGEFSDTGTVRIAIQGAQPVVTPNSGDLLVIGTPNPDMIIVTHVSAGVVRVRTDLSTAHYPVTGQLIINSGQGNDYVVATGVLVPATLDLGEGDDYGSGGLQDDLMIGGLGNDQINAGAGNNVVWGDHVGEQDLATGGNDVLSSLGGADVMYGGGGNDQVFPGAGEDYVNAGQGDDMVSSGAGNDRVFGNGGNDSLYGDEGDDVISGGAGSDTLVGRTGDDVLIGGTGGDSINGDDGVDLLFGGNTTNSASSTPGDANDLALMAMLVIWTNSHPAGLASGISGGNDGSPDSLLGFTGDDDFYVNTNDVTSDFGLPFMGTDRFFTG